MPQTILIVGPNQHLGHPKWCRCRICFHQQYLNCNYLWRCFPLDRYLTRLYKPLVFCNENVSGKHPGYLSKQSKSTKTYCEESKSCSSWYAKSPICNCSTIRNGGIWTLFSVWVVDVAHIVLVSMWLDQRVLTWYHHAGWTGQGQKLHNCPQASTYMSCWNQNIMYIYTMHVVDMTHNMYIYIYMYMCNYMCVLHQVDLAYCSCMKSYNHQLHPYDFPKSFQTERRYWYGQFGLQLLGKGCRNASARPLYGCTSFRTDSPPLTENASCELLRRLGVFFPMWKKTRRKWIMNHEDYICLYPCPTMAIAECKNDWNRIPSWFDCYPLVN